MQWRGRRRRAMIPSTSCPARGWLVLVTLRRLFLDVLSPIYGTSPDSCSFFFDSQLLILFFGSEELYREKFISVCQDYMTLATIAVKKAEVNNALVLLRALCLKTLKFSQAHDGRMQFSIAYCYCVSVITSLVREWEKQTV